MHFRVTIPAVPRREPVLDRRDRAILAALRAGKGLSTQPIARDIRISTKATRTRLLGLIDRGFVAGIGSGPNDPRKCYVLTKPAS